MNLEKITVVCEDNEVKHAARELYMKEVAARKGLSLKQKAEIFEGGMPVNPKQYIEQCEEYNGRRV